MKNEAEIKQIEKFLNEVIVKELGKIQDAGLSYMQFVLMGQAIEVLGSLLDNKPMKAKGQSSRRFSSSVNVLFGGRYRLLNNNFFLYDKLRNQMTHAFIPGKELHLIGKENEGEDMEHLQYKDGKLVLIGEVFYHDICNACERLIDYLKKGKIKPKKIALEYEE